MKPFHVLLLTKACWQSPPKKLPCCGSCSAHWTDPVFFLLEAVLWLHRRTRKLIISKWKKNINMGLYKFLSWPSEAETKLSLAEIPASLVHLHTSLLSISSFLLSQFLLCCPTSLPLPSCPAPCWSCKGTSLAQFCHLFCCPEKEGTPPKGVNAFISTAVTGDGLTIAQLLWDSVMSLFASKVPPPSS